MVSLDVEAQEAKCTEDRRPCIRRLGNRSAPREELDDFSDIAEDLVGIVVWGLWFK